MKGKLQRDRPGGGRDGLGQNIGEAGEKIDVMLVVVVLLVVVDLEYPIRLPVATLDDDVDGGNDAMGRIERRQIEISVLLQVVDIDGSPVEKARPCGELISARDTT